MDYPTVKSALMFDLTKYLTQCGETYGVRAMCVSPGPVLTRSAMANMKALFGWAADFGRFGMT